MSRRSGQRGSVYVKGSQYIGRYRADVPGQNKRVRRTVIIGNINQFTRPKAERWLSKFIEDEGINDESHLARSQSPVATFGLAARGWKTPPDRQQEALVTTQHVLRAEQAHPSTLGEHLA